MPTGEGPHEAAEAGAAPEAASATAVPTLDPAVVERELDDVAVALDRLDAGTYGTCEACGATLGDDVLAAAPAARFCGDHQPAPAP